MAGALDLTGRVVLVTGGARGVGRGIAARFLEAGATVVICGRRVPADVPVVDRRSATFVETDVRDDASVERLVATIKEREGRLDVVVNNAGGSPPADTATASARFSTAVVTLNLLAPLFVAQRANAVMQAQTDGGSIINIASVSGTRPSPTTAAYGAAKAGLLNLTQTLAVEWAPRVRVNAVTVGVVETEQAHLFYGDAAGVAAVGATVPLGRMAGPADIGDACLLLASPLARYVSGANLLVHGGGERPAYLEASTGEVAASGRVAGDQRAERPAGAGS
ncbi:MAG: SDR family oxidoreductase [Acidimicrobiales bacterium]